MAASVGSLNVDLSLGTARFQKGLSDAQGKLDGFKTKMAATATTSRQVSEGFNVVRAAAITLGAAVVGTAARSFLSLADESKNLSAQLTLATAKSGTFGQAQADVARIATLTRESLSATATLYGNFMRATEQLGGTQNQAARATETFGKALKIGGADANAAASATLQFGQALASGALRGDEFNSIAEASPRIVRLIADAMGVTQGAVRALAAEGKLTSDILFKALTDRKFTAGIDDEFSKLPVTFDQAMTLVRNAAVTTFGAFDRGGQFSTALADFIGRGTDGFASLAGRAEIEGRNIRGSFEGLRDAFAPLLSGASGAFAGIRSEANWTRESIANVLRGIDRARNLFPEIQDFVEGGNAEFRAKTGYKSKTPQRSNMAGDFERGSRRSDAESRRDAAARRLESLGYTVPRNADGSINEAGIKRDARPKPVRSVTPPASKAGKGSSGRGGGSGRGSGVSATDELQTLLDGLLPDDARIRELGEKSKALGKALAANLIPPETYKKASDAIAAQLGDLYDKVRTAPAFDGVDLKTATPSAMATPGEGADLAAQIKNAATGGVASLDILKATFQSLAHTGNSALGEIGDAVAFQLIPALEKAGDTTQSLGDRMAALSNSFSSMFSAVFGAKTGGLLGAVATLGVGFATRKSATPGKLPGFAKGGSLNVGGRSGIDRNVLSINGIPRAMVSAEERVHVTPANDRQRAQPVPIHITVEEGALFRPVIRSQAGAVTSAGFSTVAKKQAQRARNTLV